MMHSGLTAILDEKQKEIERLRQSGPQIGTMPGTPPPRDFRAAVSGSRRVNLIAEIKFASPSAGVLRDRGNPGAIARAYEEAGAAAISLVTDRKFFGGSLSDLPAVRASVNLPVLRKDFLIDEIQVRQSLAWGADAVLLIARILEKERLRGLLRLCRDLGMDALTEVHDEADLEKAVSCGADLIGINNRDLDTFGIDLSATTNLAPKVPRDCVVVSESGIRSRADIDLLRQAGVQAVLVGTALMRSGDMGKAVRDLA